MVDLTPLVLQSRPCSSKIFNHPVTNNASLSLSNFSYQSTSSTLLHDPLSSSSKQCQSFSNSSYLWISSLLLQDPHSSKILTPPRSSLLQYPHSSKILIYQVTNNASLSLSNSSYIYQSRPYSSKILHHQIANNASLFKLLSSNLVPAPPRSSILQNTNSWKILNHQDTNNASQSPPILKSCLCSSKILTPPRSPSLQSPHFAKSSLLKNLQSSSSEQC